MSNFEEKDYKVFDLFNKQWALVTAGDINHFNACTVSWGSMGTIWTRPGKSGSTITVYLYPTRRTCEVMKASDTFTVSFFSKEHRKALGIMGTLSGRDTDKVALAGLTPEAIGNSVTFAEATQTFVCRKIYQHQLTKEDIAEDVREYYAANPQAYIVDESGDWHPHWLFMGEIIDVKDNLGQ